MARLSTSLVRQVSKSLKEPLIDSTEEERGREIVELEKRDAKHYHGDEDDRKNEEASAEQASAAGENVRPLNTGAGLDPEGDTASINSFLSEDFIDISLGALERKSKWKEAALYVSEGEKDAKIYHHPDGYWSKRAFKTLHHTLYYVTHLIASILLMLLAIVETPMFREGKHSNDQAILSAHAVVEIILLSFFFLDMLLKFTWFGPRRFFTHRRTVFILIILCVMVVEAFTVLIRQENHFRITRALRPLMLIDNHYLYGVRRVMWHIFLCFKPITDVLLLILFFVVFFSLLGYYFFSDVDPSFYSSFWRSFISLFITMTTANNPDVMLEAYYEHILSPLFFVAYLSITFYYLMNVLLAVVYGSFEEEERKKFKKLFKHKLFALDKAYDLLASKADDEQEAGICFADFLMFMYYYQPYTPEWQVMCIFKALHHDDLDLNQQHQRLTKDEFHRLYEVRDLKWKHDKRTKMPSQACRRFILHIHKFCYAVMKSKSFHIIINLIVLSNLFFLIIYTMVTSVTSSDKYDVLRRVRPVSYVYISIYIIEIVLRIIGLGPYEYFRKKRNISDFIIILISFICLLLETEDQNLIFLAAVRPFKLLRVLRLKRRFRDIGSTTIVLLPRLANIIVLLLSIYYFFAIIGMETLGGLVKSGCCNTSWYGIGSSFSGIYTPNTTDNIPPSSDVYYLLNFNTITRSYVTLFVLMVVNNWFIIMEGFASEAKAGWLVRVYFISFFIVMLVILQVVISFIVDEFKFKVLDTAKKRICPKHGKKFEHCRCKRYRKKVVEITLLPADIEQLEVGIPNHYHRRRNISHLVRKLRQIKLNREMQMNFIGRRLNTKEDIKLTIFQAEIPEWTNEYYADMDRRERARTRGEGARTKRKAMLEKAKKFLRECFLYFIDWVIE